MPSEQSSELEELVARCIEARECGDETEVVRICDQHPVLAPSIQAALSALDGIVEAIEEDSEIGGKIGPFEIDSVLGEGGMGTVYRAHQTEPVRRTVALKVIKLGMDSKQVLARFEAERQALAMMNHDAIAKVFDAGTTERGQPYFVMEFVEGRTITEHCDQHEFATTERLRLFQQVCAGVQHAHQKGVIHRDLKPGNILVADNQGRPVPKIIDFGLARATEHRLTQATLYTELGQVLGTPEYMSPEQVDPESQDIDTRTDVYSLGVVLYELLVGALPFSSFELRRAGLPEIQRKIRDDDPPKPSSRLGSQEAAAGERATARRTSAQSLARELRGDLDWVVLRAMEKDRNRRYSSPSDLARDVGHYLAHQPVNAGPPSTFYRVKKFVRRYRGQVVAAALVFLALLTGLVLFAVENSRARARQAEFDLLANVVKLETAEQDEDRLFPAWPALADDMAGWLAHHAAPLLAGLPEIDAAIEALRSRARPRTGRERQADREQHPDYGAWMAAERELAARLRAQAVRDGGTAPAPLSTSAADRQRTAAHLNDEVAWPRVDPDETRTLWGEEPYGLAAARAVLAKIDAGDTSIPRHAALNTLAWAQFANGLDDLATETSAAAVLEAGLLQSVEYLGYQWKLAAAIGSAEEALTETRRTRDGLAAQVASFRTWAFPDEAHRFLHDTLVELRDRIRDFDQDLVSGVRQRLEWASRIRDATLHHPGAGATWAEARQAIRRADGTTASVAYGEQPFDLEPQLGLVPMGMNPKTHLWEFYHLRSAWDPQVLGEPADLAIPKHDAEGAIEIGAGTGIVFVLVPGGSFTMGGQTGLETEKNRQQKDEIPHEMSVTPFFIARHELTQGQWLRLAGGENPSRYDVGGDDFLGNSITADHPVEQVNWSLCVDLVRRHGLVLPTEACWEYATRAGTTTAWWTGSDLESLRRNGMVANLPDQTAARVGAPWQAIAAWPDYDDSHVCHAPVGTFRANPWGLFDVHGNVWEWCRDAYGSYALPTAGEDGLRLVPDHLVTQRVARGGSFYDSARLARSAYRAPYAPTFQSDILGVRVARAVLEQ